MAGCKPFATMYDSMSKNIFRPCFYSRDTRFERVQYRSCWGPGFQVRPIWTQSIMFCSRALVWLFSYFQWICSTRFVWGELCFVIWHPLNRHAMACSWNRATLTSRYFPYHPSCLLNLLGWKNGIMSEYLCIKGLLFAHSHRPSI